MKLSCIPVTYFDAISSGRMPVERWFDFAAELGLDGVECGPLLLEPLGPVSAAQFRKLAEARRLEVSNYTGYSDFTHPDAAVRARELEHVRANIRLALELGAPSLRVLTGQQRPEVSRRDGVNWVVDSIRRAADEAARAGLRLNLENHTKAFTWTQFDFAIRGEVFLEILDRLKDAPVGVQFDIANPLVAGEDPLALFEKVRERIGYVHVNDVARPGVFEFVPAGSGVAPLRQVLAELRRQGYQGWVGVEEASRTGEEGFRKAVGFTRQALATAD
ncbi:MAG: sugar phosphate isomerase/epimerase [Bryobacteraceae bacterium]|nr:sugar phosphate isomerase/epimerase [Bryobacteraceae bacterium]